MRSYRADRKARQSVQNRVLEQNYCYRDPLTFAKFELKISTVLVEVMPSELELGYQGLPIGWLPDDYVVVARAIGGQVNIVPLSQIKNYGIRRRV